MTVLTLNAGPSGREFAPDRQGTELRCVIRADKELMIARSVSRWLAAGSDVKGSS